MAIDKSTVPLSIIYKVYQREIQNRYSKIWKTQILGIKDRR